MNEVKLTSTNFSAATNIQSSIKDFVNRAYFDINNPEHKWPWLSTASPQDDFLGNTYIESVAGTRWYLLKDGSSDFNSDYGHIDWGKFSLTTEGVNGEVAPYENRNLHYSELEEWKDLYQSRESNDKGDEQVYGIPDKVIRSMDGRRFGLSPIPDQVYRIYFYAWDRPVKLVNYSDAINIPDQYAHVLIARARYYAWQRKEHEGQVRIASDDYKKGIRGMRAQEIEHSPRDFTDDRTRFI